MIKAITPNIEQTIVEIARVSSSRKNKSENPEGLINYLIKHKHWSPFENGFITFEIETSKAIAIQLLRHRSFSFQELSQRYQDVSKIGNDMFMPIELRKQAQDNRQSSTDIVTNPALYNSVDIVLRLAKQVYERLIKEGVSRETARMVLPLSTRTKLYMSGSVRSWIHFLDVRDDGHAQKEMQLLAKDIKKELIRELPIISNALGWL